MKKTRINFLLPDPHLQALKLVAKRRGTTYSAILRDIVREYLRSLQGADK